MGLPKTLIGLLCSFVVLQGCSLNPVAPDKNNHEAMQLIATDLVSALVQIRSIPVATTTLSLPHEQFDDSHFASALQERLERVGYAVRTVGSNPADKLVSYTIEPVEGDAEAEDAGTFTVTIGSVSVRRNYADLDSSEVHPTAVMLVKGADASHLQVNDNLFKYSAAAKTVTEGLPEVVQPASVAENVAGQEIRGLQPETLAMLQQRPLRNFRELKRSNFSDLYDSLVLVRETILPFGNDSIDLEPVARELIAQFVDEYDVQRDVFSVIGCSNGATSVAAGPKSLALGRAADVTAELIRLGVPRQSVLEEGCWSGEHFDEMMPRRGVVLSLQRYSRS